MSQPILVVRTVSVEKLSPVLDDCRHRWPEIAILVATSSGRAGELRQDGRVAGIIETPMGSDGLDHPLAFAGEAEAVVVPVSNKNGSGYANVMRACRNLNVRHRFLARPGRELKELGKAHWTWKWRSELLLGIPARWIGRLWAANLLRRGSR